MTFDLPNDKFLNNLDMTPEELSRLAVTRYLSCDHVRWFVKKINSMQTETLCIYINGVTDIDQFVQQNFTQQENLSFVLNVGKSRDGQVFLANDSCPGNHWTFLHYNSSSKTITYGDSLGWSPPANLHEVISKWLNAVFSMQEYPTITLCHESHSVDVRGRHVCTPECTPYALQTCYNVCGPVAIFAMVISVFSPDFFSSITTSASKLTNNPSPFVYFSEPTKYNKYLRRVLMSWIADDSINFHHVVPKQYLESYNEEPSSDSMSWKSLNQCR